MLYDEYYITEDSLPFTDEEKRVYMLKFPIKGKDAHHRLCMWVQYERQYVRTRGYYLYISEEEIHRGGGISIEFGNHCKVLLQEEESRKSKTEFFSACVKAGIFARDICDSIFGDFGVEWDKVKASEFDTSADVLGNWKYDFEEKEYIFKEG